MALQRRSYSSLPAYLQTNRNNLELAVTDDLLYEPEQFEFITGYIGDTSKLSEQDLARTPLLIEDTAIQQKYQFSVGVAQQNPITQNFISGAFYDDLLNHLSLNGAITNDPNRLFSAFYYAWSPPIDYDKIVNPARYCWMGTGNAVTNGEYITKEAAGSQTKIFQFNGTTLVSHNVTVVNGLPGSGTIGEFVEDASTADRLIYEWNGSSWGVVNYLLAADVTVSPNYFVGDFVYVCRTGSSFNRPVVWAYRDTIGRWISIPVVIDINQPETPLVGMIWEDATVPPARVLRIWDGSQWKALETGTQDPFSTNTITYTQGTGPSGTPTGTTYLFDTRAISAIDTWSAQNWWRALTDLSVSDKGNLPLDNQGARPIIEFWGNIEGATGVTRTSRNTFPYFNIYSVAPSTFEIQKVTPSNFPGLVTAPLIASGNYKGGSVVSTIFDYIIIAGQPDPVLGFNFKHGSDGTPEFQLGLELLTIVFGAGPLLGYRYFRDTSTGLVHSIWEKTDQVLLQTEDGNGLFNIPLNLQFNPDHIVTTNVDRSDYINHFTSIIQSQDDFSGTPFGANNYRYTPKNLTANATMIDPEESLQRVMSVLQTGDLDIPDAIRQMSRDYNKVLFRFLQQLNNYWNDGTLSTVTDTLTVTAEQAVDAVLTTIFANRNDNFPYFHSIMGTYINTTILNGSVLIFDSTPQPIYIPDSAAQIGASPPFIPQKFLDDDGITKIRGHDGSLIPAYGDARDDCILNLENRFFVSINTYLTTETSSFSGRYSSTFQLQDYYGNFTPNLTAGTVVEIVSDYTTIPSPSVSPGAFKRIYSINQQVYATWDTTQWLLSSAQVGDVFQNTANSNYYIFNGFYANQIVTWNKDYDFDYSEQEFRQIIQREFERWVVTYGLDFTTNNQFNQNNAFTWNFSSAGVEGNWRGIYRRIYNTIRPHSHPWEVVGYTVQPSWWLSHYVPTSTASDGTPRYTNTHPMWTDLHNGVINPFVPTSLARMAMIAPTPVDSSGNLLDPIAAGVVNETDLTFQALGDDWAYGDGGPVEQSFYDSYYYQFAIALAGYLMKTTLFVDRTWSEFYREVGETGPNILWNAPAIVYNTTLTRPPAASVPVQLSLDATGNQVTSPGLNAWISEYANIIGLSANLNFSPAIVNSSAVLGWKTSGFINRKATQITLLDGNEVPNENLSVVVHEGPSVDEYYQSGIIIIRDLDGFRVFGTDVLNSFFTVNAGAVPSNTGTIETTDEFTYDGVNLHPASSPSTSYPRSAIVVTSITIPPSTNDSASFAVVINGYRIASKYIQVLSPTSFALDPVLQLNSGDLIVATVVNAITSPSASIGSFTVNNVQVTYFATGSGQIIEYPYGTLFRTINDVVNMMVGYGRWLLSQGWQFERLTNGSLRDWLGASFAFASWATNLTIEFNGNPSLMQGQIFQYSVMGRQTQFISPFGQCLGVEDIRNGSYGVVDVNNKPVEPNHLQVVSTGGNIQVSSDNTDIYGLRVYISEIQHVIFFPNADTFGDILYEPALGLIQDAVIVQTYRTKQWDGTLSAPGFLISNGQIGVLPAGSTPTPPGALFPNWEKQVRDIERFYDPWNPPDDPTLTAMARSIFGYIPQSYMNELVIDDRAQFNFFMGSLKAKGSFQPYQAFIRGTTATDVAIFEDWAWKFAKYGDARHVRVLFSVNQDDFVDPYQAIVFDPTIYAITFTGDENTNSFTVPERFMPQLAVVTINGDLQVNNVDYTMSPSDAGWTISFVFAPLRGTHVVVSINDSLVHAQQTSVFVAPNTGGILKLPGTNTVTKNNILFAVGGELAQAGVGYTTDFPNSPTTITYTDASSSGYGLVFGNAGEDIFSQIGYVGDGFTTEFNTGLSNQTLNSVIVVRNGLLQSPSVHYTIDNSFNTPYTYIDFTSTPNLGDTILLISQSNPNLCDTRYYTATANGSQVQFNVPGINLLTYRDAIVSVGGVVNIGEIPDQNVPFTYRVANGGILFSTAPASGELVNIFVFLDMATNKVQPLEDDRVIHVPPFSPPDADTRWVLPPPQDLYRDRPFRFPTLPSGGVDFQKYLYSAALVDQNAELPATTIFHWDPARDVHLNEPLALSNIDFRTPYDPALYNQGPLAGSTDSSVWGANQVGRVWWNISSAVYSPYDSFVPNYIKCTREWGKLQYFSGSIVRVNDTVTVTTLDPSTSQATAHGLINGQTIVISGADQPTYNGSLQITVVTATTFIFSVTVPADTPATGDIVIQVGLINCYEWVASPVPPSAWNIFVSSQTGFDVYTGIALNTAAPANSTTGYAPNPAYVGNPSWVQEDIWDVNGNKTTTYYFWVQSNTRVIPTKNISVNDIAGRLTSPADYEVPYFGIIDDATIFVFSGTQVVQDNSAIELTYSWLEMPQHIEWLLIGENDDFSQIPPLVTDKLLDSMLSEDSHGNPVPNSTLAPVEIYGTSNFPAQTVFQDAAKALSVYLFYVNSLLVNTNINTVPLLFAGLSTSDEQTDSHLNGYWAKTTWWMEGIDPIVYATVVSQAELNFFTQMRLYYNGDIVKVIQSSEVDPWTSAQVAAYYQYTGTSWNLVGIDNQAVAINSNILNSPSIFRQFFADLTGSVTVLQMNVILFAVFYEMVRQNPSIDWFFKTSYIDIHATQDLPITPYVYPDQVTIITDAVLNLKPYRTKIRDQVATYIGPEEIANVDITETQTQKDTLVFDRVACDLTDENAWDTIPWDATVTYPETEVITIPFTGNGVLKCFTIPEIVPPEEIVVFVNSQLAAPNIDYTINPADSELCFTVAPVVGAAISVVIDGPYSYIGNFEYTFTGNASIDSEVLPNAVAQTVAPNIFSTWDGVHQIPTTDFSVVVTSDTEVVYASTPPVGLEVNGTVFGGVVGNIFVESAYTGDGTTVSFSTTIQNQSVNTIVAIIDGVWQTPGVDYGIDNTTHTPTSYVSFTSAPTTGTKVIIYAVSTPNWVDSHSYVYVGDGSTTDFVITNLDTAFPPSLLVNINGIQQNDQVGDYSQTAAGIHFDIAPENGANIAVFAVFSGIGTRITGSGVSFPATIEWDWAFWNYPDLGRQEFDFAGFFVGDGTTESFTIPIPQATSSLYPIQINYFQNGQPVTLTQLGLTQTITKLSTGVSVFLSAALPNTVYGAIYIARGFYEGLEPTFGFQDPSGIVYAPTPSSYQHFFARLISATFDPSTDMAGCPSHTPEERIQSDAEDSFTIVVQTGIQPTPTFVNVGPLVGQVVAAHAGTFAFMITTNPHLTGEQVTASVGQMSFTSQPAPFDMTGQQVIAAVGTLIPDIIPNMVGQAGSAATGSFTFQETTTPSMQGEQVNALVSSLKLPDVEVTGAAAVLASHGDFIVQVSPTGHFQGLSVMAALADLRFDSISDGLGVLAKVGLFDPSIKSFNFSGVAATAQVGLLHAQRESVPLVGEQVTASAGRLIVSSSP